VSICASPELLRPDLVEITWQYSGMKKKRETPNETRRTTIASIKKEMEMPRLTESVRNDSGYQATVDAQVTPNGNRSARGNKSTNRS
jgi:hypothetical protein